MWLQLAAPGTCPHPSACQFSSFELRIRNKGIGVSALAAKAPAPLVGQNTSAALYVTTDQGATLQARAGSGAEMVTAASSPACSASSAASSEPMPPAAAHCRPGQLRPCIGARAYMQGLAEAASVEYKRMTASASRLHLQ